jgi:hypothetical protein
MVKKEISIQGSDSLKSVSENTGRKERVWLKGEAVNLDVYRIPISYLYFNIENGRYADKMIQLRAENQNVDIDPRKDEWKKEIMSMLMGEYKGNMQGTGTENDSVAFNRLFEDIKARTQLKPGIVLADGGVIDGNRRLSVLLSLYQGEDNPDRFAYFDGVILPDDVSAEDRWKIEAGTQLGRDQQLDYSPINKLLKIREGHKLFKNSSLPKGKTPEDMVSTTLYGIPRDEIKESIKRISLIDEYLEFFGKSGQYHIISGSSEKFKEALKNIEAAKNRGMSPEDIKKLKLSQFIIIRGNLMQNWDMRKINSIIGGNPKSRGRKQIPIKKALDILIKNTPEPKDFKKLCEDGKEIKTIETFGDTCNVILEMEKNAKKENKPIMLATTARLKLESLEELLRCSEEDPTEKEPIIKQLKGAEAMAKQCIGYLK